MNAELLGSLELVTAPSGLAVDLERAKRQLRITDDVASENSYIQDLIETATEFCELNVEGHRQILTAVYDLPLYDWWAPGDRLSIPRPPLASVGSVKYFDTSDTEQTWSSSNYQVRTPCRQPGTIEILPQVTPASVSAFRSWPITIRFTAGYGAADDVPPTIRQAILLLVSHWYEKREPVGQASGEVLFTVTNLLQSQGWGSYA